MKIIWLKKLKRSNFYDIIPSTCSLKFIIHVKIKNQFQKIFSKIVCNFQLTVKLHESFLLNGVRVNPLYFNQIYETGLERKFVRSLLSFYFRYFVLYQHMHHCDYYAAIFARAFWRYLVHFVATQWLIPATGFRVSSPSESSLVNEPH